MHSRRYSAFISYRHADNTQEGRRWAEWLHRALEVSDYLIVLCSPRSAVSPWVSKEVEAFKELGCSDRILAIIIAGEPNTDDPAKAREGILRDEECFCEELRFGAVQEDPL